LKVITSDDLGVHAYTAQPEQTILWAYFVYDLWRMQAIDLE
jgi:hypothetical protein